MKTIFKLAVLLLLVCTFNACHKAGHFETDLTKDRIEVKIKRFDLDMIHTDTLQMKKSVEQLYKKYPAFMSAFCTQVLNANMTDTTQIAERIKKFLNDTTFRSVNTKVDSVFKNIKPMEKQLSDAFTRIHHFFPKAKLPEVYFFVSGFNSQVIFTDSIIGFATDLYLGADFRLYNGVTYDYLRYNMRPDALPVDIVSTTLFRMLPMNTTEERLLDYMIFKGKVMYLVSSFMPSETPENIMGYTKDQWKWCEKYEKDIWATIIDRKYLFSTDIQLIRKFVNEAPFTAPVSQDSPGLLGTWVGWRIVQSYVEHHPETTPLELINIRNSEKFLQDSQYHPK